MKRIVVLGPSGGFGASWCDYAAARLAQRLDMRCIRAAEPAPSAADPSGWVATATVGALSAAMLRLADTAIWLHFLPPAVTRAWLRGLRARLKRAALQVERQPGLPDLRDSLIHMAWTPHVHRLLRHPALAHLQVFHLRSPDETDFWLRAQEHRLPHPGAVDHSARLKQPSRDASQRVEWRPKKEIISSAKRSGVSSAM